ncbi:Alpha-L-fucosidase [Neorhodopirellula lusitana]|uniref:alpha-L-fucosidase n=1 Tax=Neorhodopirellula lusitana TaxID=445327 RepID=A0ABY1Q0M6_9BACT|nr:alpha-L-fucosidase [Neorhodopirellula lusitana]SMP55692.1 Alpha-L-fucosidase [Neorhodopirellula lusitana]
MKIKAFVLLGCLSSLVLSSNVAAQTDAVAEQLQWFRDAKFGMFIHFQAPRNGDFNPVNLDTKEWVRIAKAGGMKYITLTTSQSSYVPLWNSSFSDRDVTDRTDFKRDIVRELAASCKAEGIRMGCYYPIADPPNPIYNEPDVGGEIRPYVDYLHGMMKELCEEYQPCLIWFDASRRFKAPAEKPLLRQQDMVDMLHSYGTLSNSRLGDDDALKFVDYLTMNDNMAPSINLGVHFESAVTMGRSWHYRANDTLKTPQVLLEQLVNTAGNGGNYLLNVGPDQDGVIPIEMEERLKVMGDWLQRNGEAIYETEPGPYRYEINWGTITQRKNKDTTSLYLNLVDWPKDGKFTLFGVNNPVLTASLLATGETIQSESKLDPFSGQHLVTLKLPKEAPDEYVSVIKIELAGDVSMDPAHMQMNDGKVIMDTYNASIHDVPYVPGKPTKAIDMKMFTVPDRRPLQPSDHTGPWDYQMYRRPGEGIMPGRAITVSGFQTKGQALSWDFKVFEPGTYDVVVNCNGVKSQGSDGKGKLRANVAGQSIESNLNFTDRGRATLGKIQIDASGTYTFTLEVASAFNNAPKFRSVVLAPVAP